MPKRKTTVPASRFPNKPEGGAFISSPIHGGTEEQAKEILSRTYKPDLYNLHLSVKQESKMQSGIYLHWFWIEHK